MYKLTLPNFTSSINAWFILGFSLFLAAFYTMPGGKILSNFYYVCALPPALYFLIKTKGNIFKSGLGVAVLLLLLYLVTSTSWTENSSGKDIFQSLKHVLYLICFLSGIALLYRYPHRFWPVMRIMLLGACIGLAINAWEWFSLFQGQGRLSGIVGPRNSVDLGVAYGFAAVLAAASFQADHRQRWLSALLFFILAGGLLLTQTRVAIVAFALALLVLIMFRIRNREGIILAATAVIIMGAGLALGQFDRFQVALDEVAGIQARISIWEKMFQIVQDKSILLGMGLRTPLEIEVLQLSARPFSTAHNLYVGTFFFDGVIALELMISMLAICLIKSCKWAKTAGDSVPFSLLIYAAVASLAHGTELLSRPNDVWFFWWISVALTLSVTAQNKRLPSERATPV